MVDVRVLVVVNKKIPEGDYRLEYGKYTNLSVVTYAMPDRPCSLSPSRFVRMRVGEGFSISQPFHLIAHFVHLILHRSRYDLVHYYSTWLILFGPIFAYLARLPSIITVTGFGRTFTSNDYKYLRPFYWILLKLSLRLTRTVLIQNHADIQQLSELFPKYQYKIKYIGSAVSATIVPEKNFHSSELIVLSVMRLMPDKGVQNLLDIASALSSQGVHFYLAGPQSVGFKDLYKQVIQADRLGIINFLGELEYDELMSEYNKAHVFLFPSYAEGMARVMLEAGYALLCPVAYDIPANRELVSEDRGCLVPFKSTQHMIEVLSTLNHDRDRLKQLAKNYQKWVVTNFNMSEFVQRMDRIVNEAIL